MVRVPEISSAPMPTIPPSVEPEGSTNVASHEPHKEPVSPFVVVGAGLVAFLVTVAAGLFISNAISKGAPGKPGPHATPTTGPSTHASASATSSTTATTSGTPSAPQANPSAAAALLVSSWAAGNKAQALSVATDKAVTTLFGATYQAGRAIARGCSTGFQPVTCTYGPLGGASPTDEIYQLSVVSGPRGWYVSAVTIDN